MASSARRALVASAARAASVRGGTARLRQCVSRAVGVGSGGSDDDDEVARFSAEALLDLPPPSQRAARVTRAEYVSSAVRLDQCPGSVAAGGDAAAGAARQELLPELAVIGRSNVGKSSLINMLTGRRDLAHISKKPGKTQTINHFRIGTAAGDAFYLVDLPGYGYAKASTTSRMSWLKFTKDFFTERRQLLMVFVLVDSSIPPVLNDVMALEWLHEHGVPSTVVFTKADKKTKAAAGDAGGGGGEDAPSRYERKSGNIRRFYERLLEMSWEEPPPYILTSSAEGYGKSAMLNYVSALLRADRAAGGGVHADEEEEEEERMEVEGAKPDASTALPWIQKTLSHSKTKRKGKAAPQRGARRKAGARGARRR